MTWMLSVPTEPGIREACLPIPPLPVTSGGIHVAVRLSSSPLIPREARPAYTFRAGAGRS